MDSARRQIPASHDRGGRFPRTGSPAAWVWPPLPSPGGAHVQGSLGEVQAFGNVRRPHLGQARPMGVQEGAPSPGPAQPAGRGRQEALHCVPRSLRCHSLPSRGWAHSPAGPVGGGPLSTQPPALVSTCREGRGRTLGEGRYCATHQPALASFCSRTEVTGPVPGAT